ncbi:MAG: ATPase [marine bacterium B5-7]|nr:MAG: ATPase [marine bacterium B5-7]
MQTLLDWKADSGRLPLIVRGARQVGKSWLIAEFAKNYKHFVKINFEKTPSAKNMFEGDIDIQQILNELSLLSGKPVEPEHTLIFLDEVQECERAIIALRYFKEEFPQYHVIAAGSLIDFTLENIGMPVGRVQFLYMHPLSFEEYLIALGHNALIDAIHAKNISPVIHEKLLGLVKNYLWLGGMPAVIDEWILSENITRCQKIQERIINAYKQDFEKYAKKHQRMHVARVFSGVPKQLGKKFVYKHLDEELRAIDVKSAIDLLHKAGILHYCYHTAGHEQPLGAESNEKKFKLFFFDIGLALKLLGRINREWIIEPVSAKLLGPIAEQFVAQELVACQMKASKEDLYYWRREVKSSNAEVDFIIAKAGKVIPVEVKAGKSGQMKSMHAFLESHPNSSHGVKISEFPFAAQQHLLDVPFYGLNSWLDEGG